MLVLACGEWVQGGAMHEDSEQRAGRSKGFEIAWLSLRMGQFMERCLLYLVGRPTALLTPPAMPSLLVHQVAEYGQIPGERLALTRRFSAWSPSPMNRLPSAISAQLAFFVRGLLGAAAAFWLAGCETC